VTEVEHFIIDMCLDASEVRNTVRVLYSSPNTVFRELKKNVAALEPVNICSAFCTPMGCP
jgi:hypothetical protein